MIYGNALNMDTPPKAVVFILGCVGAIAPEIIRLYKLRRKAPKELFTFWVYVASLLYAGFGGLVAITLPAVNVGAAFYAGITTPTLISAIARRKTMARGRVALANDNVHLRASDASHRPEPSTPGAIRHYTVSPLSALRTVFAGLRNHADGLFD